MLEHCCEGDSNFGPPFFGAFPSDHIPEVMKDVNVHVFIYSFTFRDELVMESALTVKKNKTSNITFPLAQLPQTFCFEMIMISIQDVKYQEI